MHSPFLFEKPLDSNHGEGIGASSDRGFLVSLSSKCKGTGLRVGELRPARGFDMLDSAECVPVVEDVVELPAAVCEFMPVERGWLEG